MVVVVSSPLPIQKESDLINQLFENGLEYFHLRKPDYGEDEIIAMLNEISSKYHKHISLHTHLHLAEDFKMNRLHFNEFKRENGEYKNYGKDWIKSTSIHSDTILAEGLNEFDYCFYGPVFNSISKEGYHKMNSLNIDHIRKIYINKVIGIGGIDDKNLNVLKKKGYGGIAVLGSIWQQSQNAVLNFKTIQDKWINSGQ